jgi:hypothetical protein
VVAENAPAGRDGDISPCAEVYFFGCKTALRRFTRKTKRFVNVEQQALFHEDINDALRAAVKACGGTKAVASTLWPEKTINDAQSYLNDCLNSKLSPEHVLLLLKWAREKGFHGAIGYLCTEAGYTPPLPVEPEDELARLEREYINAVKVLQSITPKIENARANLRSVG